MAEHSRPIIALCVMVKNEEKTLPRLLASVEGFADKVIAYDTGSTDKTLDILAAAGADVLRGEFVDFGKSRTELMEYARGKADWFLLLDADHTIRTGLPVDASDGNKRALGFAAARSLLDPSISAYSLMHAGNLQYWVPRLVRASVLNWRYVGSTHEYLERSETAVKFPAIVVEHHADGGSRSDKFERDYRLLSAEVKADPTNSRAVFYLANTERDLGRLSDARDHYLQRAVMGGWDEEVFVARLEAGKISLDPLELWEAWASRPWRAEPLHVLARVYMGRGEITKSFAVDAIRRALPLPKQDLLFVETKSYGTAGNLHPQPLRPCDTIPGWFDFEDFYRKLISLLPKHGGTFVEVGTFLGRSFATFDWLAKAVDKSIYLVAVDTFKGTPTEPNEAKSAAQHGNDFEGEFMANMKRCGVTNYEVNKCTSFEAAPKYDDHSIDAVFIDGDHSYQAVCTDINSWARKVKANGFIAGHDYDRPDVRKAVAMCLPGAEVRVYGRCWLVHLKP